VSCEERSVKRRFMLYLECETLIVCMLKAVARRRLVETENPMRVQQCSGEWCK
jgi:hypothetical protein